MFADRGVLTNLESVDCGTFPQINNGNECFSALAGIRAIGSIDGT